VKVAARARGRSQTLILGLGGGQRGVGLVALCSHRGQQAPQIRFVVGLVQRGLGVWRGVLNTGQ
jgi:hypothetical protein